MKICDVLSPLLVVAVEGDLLLLEGEDKGNVLFLLLRLGRKFSLWRSPRLGRKYDVMKQDWAWASPLQESEVIGVIGERQKLASSVPVYLKITTKESHIFPKASGTSKKNATQEIIPYAGSIFHALSCGEVCCLLTVKTTVKWLLQCNFVMWNDTLHDSRSMDPK